MEPTESPSTQTFDALNRAIEINKQNVEAFKKMIVDQLNFIIEHLQECDPTNASDALDLTIPQLTSVVAKLNDKRGLLTTDVESILAPLKAIQLRKAPDSATPLSIGPKRNSLSQPSTAPPPSALPQPPTSLQSPAAPSAPPVQAVPTLPSAPPGSGSTAPQAKSPLGSITSPGAVPSNGRNPGLTPGRRGGRRTRRKTRR
jgi:hypothetical protein